MILDKIENEGAIGPSDSGTVLSSFLCIVSGDKIRTSILRHRNRPLPLPSSLGRSSDQRGTFDDASLQ